MTAHPLELTREQILAFRRQVNALDERRSPGPASLRVAAWAGLQDSMPRAALLSIHARVAGTAPDVLDDPALTQLWGPRFSAFVVATVDRAVFTLGRLPEAGRRRTRATELADRLEAFLDGRSMPYGEAGHSLGIHPNELRYAAPTGRVLIQWDGARQPRVRSVPAPEVDPLDARLELARRYLHVYGPATPAGFEAWAGIRSPGGIAAFDGLAGETMAVKTPIGGAWVLAEDEAALRAPVRPAAAARLLPSGDAFFLLQAPDRELLVPDPELRAGLWTPRVWPGSVLVGGELAGTWRRSEADLAIEPWRRFTAAEREAVVVEAESLPLPGLIGRLRVRWTE